MHPERGREKAPTHCYGEHSGNGIRDAPLVLVSTYLLRLQNTLKMNERILGKVAILSHKIQAL